MLTFLLPYIEANNAYDLIDCSLSIKGGFATTDRWNFSTGGYKAAQAKIASFLCPSVDAYITTDSPQGAGITTLIGYGNGNEAAKSRLNGVEIHDPAVQLALGRTNYVACGGFWGYSKLDTDFVGLFEERSEFGFRDMQDGSSNIILAGETRGDYATADDAEIRSFFCWISASYMCTRYGFQNMETKAKGWHCYEGAHTGGITQFVFGDGSVHALPRSIDLTTYKYLGGILDGNIVSNDAY